ncbi:hypothetical protein SK128_024982 [Halocaridina rubra]|uniref:Uncharacterized protein n=1 Tax=Halocaridina rubra TaxID=373956 RepID=A0AAN8XX36_HALRR
MTHEDVNELIDCHSQPLTDEDLDEITKSASEEEEELEESHEPIEEPGLALERLAAIKISVDYALSVEYFCIKLCTKHFYSPLPRKDLTIMTVVYDAFWFKAVE